MTFAIPLYLYIEANNPQEAQQIKSKVEQLLNNPLVSTAMKQASIPQRGFRVYDPQASG